MKARLASLLQVRPGEALLAGYVSALFALLEVGRGLGANSADGLFFVRYGVEFLPYLFMALGVVTICATLLYSTGLGRFKKDSFFVGVLFVFVVVLLLERSLIFFNLPGFYPVLWVTIKLVNAVLGILMWNVATEVCDARQAKRLFSLFVSAGIAGGLVGNFFTGFLAKIIGTENLLVLYAAILLAGLFLIRRLSRRLFRPGLSLLARKSWSADVRSGFEFVRRSILFRMVVIASFLFSILNFNVSFTFSKSVSAAFLSEERVAGYLGIFYGAATVVTLLVSLLIANRLYSRFGVVNSALALPLTYLAGFGLLALGDTLATASLVRLAQLVILGGIFGGAWGTLFNVVPVERRAQVQSFDSGIAAQLGVSISGVFLILSQRVLASGQAFGVSILLALFSVLLVWGMRHGYASELLSALRGGFLELFPASQPGLQAMSLDANARRALIAGILDASPAVRRISVEMAGELNLQAATGSLVQAMEDADPQVRQAAVSSLGKVAPQELAGRIEARFADPEPGVRVAALEALAVLRPSPVSSASVALQDPCPEVRSSAAVALYQAGREEEALSAVRQLLNSTEKDDQVAGLEACARLGTGIEVDNLRTYLLEGPLEVQLAAIKALCSLPEEVSSRLLLQALDHPEERVRREAALTLKSFGSVRSSLIELLSSEADSILEVIPLALRGDDPVERQALLDWASAQIQEARRWRGRVEALRGSKVENGSLTLAFLRDLLKQQEWKVEGRILYALGAISTPETMHLITLGLHAEDAHRRAQALEALDTLGERRIARELLPLLEDVLPPGQSSDPLTALKELADSPHPWVRALALRAWGEMFSRDWENFSKRADQDPEKIVREAALGVVNKVRGDMADTLNTLGMMDRILFLRQVPLFNNLAPQDLQRIAEVAAERVIPAGDYLCRQGDRGDELFIIVEGQVRILKGSENARQILRLMQPGEYLGELAILREQSRRTASALAEDGPVRLLVLRGEALKSILRERPAVSLAMLVGLAERLVES